jgi:hypothetical protein
MHLPQAQEGHAFIQRPTEGFMPFELGAGGAHLSEVVMAHTCLCEHANEGLQTLLSRDDGTLSAVKFPLSGKELVLQLGDHG